MARSTITVQQVIADARMLAGAEDYANPTETSMLLKYNLVINKIYKLLNGVKFRRFMAHSPLGTPSAYRVAIVGDNQTYTASTKTITATTVAAADVGGLVMWYDGTLSKAYFSYITSAVVNTSFVVANGGSANIIATKLSYIVLSPPTGTSHSIESMRVDDIVRVQFTSAGNAPIVDEDILESVASNPNYDNVSAVAQTGTGGNGVVAVKAGSGVTNNGGFPVIFFEEKPYKATAVTDSVDLPIEYHSMLVEEMARLAVLELGAKVPKALENPLLTIESIGQTFDATKQAFARGGDKA